MNIEKIKKELNNLYPDKDIFLLTNSEGEVVEILCEVEPSKDHPEHSKAIAVINSSKLHYHKVTTETYKIIKGSLDLFVDDQKITLHAGDEYTITPRQKHRAEGAETWVEVYSEPGWTFEDHILVEKG
jgi:mannose-6-phosphate isomerase-like protein (cupin superfamily)